MTLIPGAACLTNSNTSADNDAVLQLTGVYHNLLWQWAES